MDFPGPLFCNDLNPPDLTCKRNGRSLPLQWQVPFLWKQVSCVHYLCVHLQHLPCTHHWYPSPKSSHSPSVFQKLPVLSEEKKVPMHLKCRGARITWRQRVAWNGQWELPKQPQRNTAFRCPELPERNKPLPAQEEENATAHVNVVSSATDMGLHKPLGQIT